MKNFVWWTFDGKEISLCQIRFRFKFLNFDTKLQHRLKASLSSVVTSVWVEIHNLSIKQNWSSTMDKVLILVVTTQPVLHFITLQL